MSKQKGSDTADDRIRELHAVIEAVSVAPDFVTGLPELPWPTWVRLSEDADDASVALVVAVLAQYGHSGARPADLSGLLSLFPRVAPGGLAAFDGSASITLSFAPTAGWARPQRSPRSNSPSTNSWLRFERSSTT